MSGISDRIMSMHLSLAITGAYRQLQPVEKAYVDQFVAAVEADAARQRITLAEVLDGSLPSGLINELLQRERVQFAINERVKQIDADNQITTYLVLKHLKAIATSSIADYWDIGENGVAYIDFAKATPEQLLAVKSYEYEQTPRGAQKVKFALHDKVGPLLKICDMLGLTNPDSDYWRERNARTVEVSRPDDVNPTNQNDLGDYYARMLQVDRA